MGRAADEFREGSRPIRSPGALLDSSGDWPLQPAYRCGGSGCPLAVPRAALFLRQPPVLGVLPVPPQPQ